MHLRDDVLHPFEFGRDVLAGIPTPAHVSCRCLARIGNCRSQLLADCVAKLFAALRTRNNRIQRVSILNQ